MVGVAVGDQRPVDRSDRIDVETARLAEQAGGGGRQDVLRAHGRYIVRSGWFGRFQKMQPLFITSGDLIADRRYDAARHYWARGDLLAAADIMAQAVEAAPRFASAWFALGEIREELGDRDGAIAAFRQARSADTDDRHGAGLHLMRLGAEPFAAMPPAYVRTLFDQYAPEFDRALLDILHYRGPRVLRDAVIAALHAAGRAPKFSRAIDLGCGTGLSARACARYTDEIIGFDLS